MKNAGCILNKLSGYTFRNLRISKNVLDCTFQQQGWTDWLQFDWIYIVQLFSIYPLRSNAFQHWFVLYKASREQYSTTTTGPSESRIDILYVHILSTLVCCWTTSPAPLTTKCVMLSGRVSMVSPPPSTSLATLASPSHGSLGVLCDGLSSCCCPFTWYRIAVQNTVSQWHRSSQCQSEGACQNPLGHIINKSSICFRQS